MTPRHKPNYEMAYVRIPLLYFIYYQWSERSRSKQLLSIGISRFLLSSSSSARLPLLSSHTL